MHLPWRDVCPLGRGGPPISTSITDAEASQLAHLAAGQRVLEVGSAFGYSSIVMALGGAELVTAVDPHTQLRSYPAMAANLGAYAVADRVEILAEPSGALLPHLLRTGARFGLVFVDGDHRFGPARRDLSLARDLLEPGGVIACHDYLESCCCPDVRRAADEVFPEGGQVTDTLLVVTP